MDIGTCFVCVFFSHHRQMKQEAVMPWNWKGQKGPSTS